MNDEVKVKEEIPAELVEKPDQQEMAVVNEQLPAGTTAAEISSMSPIQQMQAAKAMGLSVQEMKDMLEVQKDWERNEARKAFYAALAEFKKNPPTVVKDLINQKYGSAYTSIGNMVNKVAESLSDYGLSTRWDFPEQDNPDKIVVSCILSHALGHEEKVTLTGTPDKEGSKNPLQERKSARTYLKLETFEGVTGMASVFANVNDDGNAAGKAPEIVRITEQQALELDAKLTDNDLDRAPFTNWLAKCFPYTQGDPDALAAEHYKKVMAKIDESIKHKKEKDAE